METTKEIINHWTAKVLASPERVSGIGATYKFIVEGSTGGTWRVACKDPVSVTEGDGPSDCTVTVGEQDFIALVNKRMNPQIAFISGKIKLAGDITLALKLGEFL